MANLLTSTDIVGLTGSLGDHFDTFKREIVIFKEPIRVINNVTSNNSYAGYGETSNEIEFTYLPVSGVYSGIVSYYEDQQSEMGESIGNLFLGQGKIKVKIEQDARDFILNGSKTEAIDIDNNTFNKFSSERVQDYLGLKYYVFYLEKTN